MSCCLEHGPQAAVSVFVQAESISNLSTGCYRLEGKEYKEAQEPAHQGNLFALVVEPDLPRHISSHPYLEWQ